MLLLVLLVQLSIANEFILNGKTEITPSSYVPEEVPEEEEEEEEEDPTTKWISTGVVSFSMLIVCVVVMALVGVKRYFVIKKRPNNEVENDVEMAQCVANEEKERSLKEVITNEPVVLDPPFICGARENVMVQIPDSPEKKTTGSQTQELPEPKPNEVEISMSGNDESSE